jgi:hypothetical protein
MNALTLDAVRPEIVHCAAIVRETPADSAAPEKGRPSARPGRKLRHRPVKSAYLHGRSRRSPMSLARLAFL